MKAFGIIMLLIAAGAAGAMFYLQQGRTIPITLYYYSSGKDTDASGDLLCSRKGLVAVNRTMKNAGTELANLDAAVRLLLKGNLTDQERSWGITTEYPLPGLEYVSSDLSDGTLTLTFNDPQNRTSGGSCRAGVLWYQIEATAKQFPGIDDVRFRPETLFQP